MTYEKIFATIKKSFSKANVKNFTDSFAFQFNITGDGEGIFYVAFKDGALAIEPYDYKDRDVILTSDGATLIAIAGGKLEPIDAIKSGKLAIDGNYDLSKQLMFLVEKSTAAKKPAAKKAAAKPAAKKEAAKPAVKADAPKAVAKAESPKAAAAVKTEAPKATAKPAAKTTK